jgi:hypothetical protein
MKKTGGEINKYRMVHLEPMEHQVQRVRNTIRNNIVYDIAKKINPNWKEFVFLESGVLLFNDEDELSILKIWHNVQSAYYPILRNIKRNLK